MRLSGTIFMTHDTRLLRYRAYIQKQPTTFHDQLLYDHNFWQRQMWKPSLLLSWQHLWYSSSGQTQAEGAAPILRANLTRVTSPLNSITDGSRLTFSVIFSYFLFIFYLPRCTLPDFPSVSSLASLPFLPCCHLTTSSILYLIIQLIYRGEISYKPSCLEIIPATK